MSVHIAEGEPGSGKSYIANDTILTELEQSPLTWVVTNVAMREGQVREFLGPRIPADGILRLRLLADDEVRTFWRERGDHKIQVEQVTDPDGYRRFKVVGAVTAGVLYVIDEAHNYFRARDYQKTSQEALWYLSQHRQWGDTVFVITQNRKNLDVAFTRIAETFTICRSSGKIRVALFRLWKGFSRVQFPEVPGPGVPSRLIFRRLNKKRAECYETAAAANAPGTAQADKGQKLSGIHIGWAAILVVLFLVGMLSWPYLSSRFVGAALRVGGNQYKPVQRSGPVFPSAIVGNKSEDTVRVEPAPAVPEKTVVAEDVLDPRFVARSFIKGAEWAEVRTYGGLVFRFEGGVVLNRRGLVLGPGITWYRNQEPKGMKVEEWMAQ